MQLLSGLRTILIAGLAAALPVGGVANANIDDLVPADLPSSFSGSYLAGLSADVAKDIGSAVAFYGEAVDADAENAQLVDRLLLLSLADGKYDEAFVNAEALLGDDLGNRTARVVLAIQAMKAGDYDEVETQLAEMESGALPTLVAGLLTAWAQFGEGDVEKALDTISALDGPGWYASFKATHAAYMLDAVGRRSEAVEAITADFQNDKSMPVTNGLAHIFARAGKADAAVALIEESSSGVGLLDPAIAGVLNAGSDGETIPPIAANAQEGAAEVLFGLGFALGTDDGPEQPAAYMQLAAYLKPTSTIITRQIGRVFQIAGRCEDAITVYDTIPADADVRREADIQIAICLATDEQTDAAAAQLSPIVEENRDDVPAATALGNIYRWAERYEEAAAAYTIGIDAIGDPGPSDWRIFYYRGVSYFFTDEWPKAEADFLTALELSPEEPDVLNFLGYSWVDQGMHLDKALGMIERAVELRPRSGYIVDSLGWAYYQLGEYDEAVRYLEHALELQAYDATLNDHLGDAYWQVGRKREAMFQWTHARDFEPSEDQLQTILRKLEVGLEEAHLEAPADDPPPG